jgi:hypothetical protein
MISHTGMIRINVLNILVTITNSNFRKKIMKLFLFLFSVVQTLHEGSCDYYKVPISSIYGSQNLLKCSMNIAGKCLCQMYHDSKEWDCLSEPVELLASYKLN